MNAFSNFIRCTWRLEDDSNFGSDKLERILSMKCVACGSAVLVEGSLMDSNGSTTSFKLAVVSTLKSLFGVGTRSVRAYGCIRCHHLQLAVDFSEKDFQRFQQFEGEQPGVLERINLEPKKSKKLKK
jgi:hypothetical protein